MPSFRHRFLSTVAILFFTAPSIISATCYWQNSTLAPDDAASIARDDTACFPDQENSPCCGTGWSCLSDGVCYIEEEGTGFYYRGTCTDKTWDSQQCPGWCFAENANTSIPLAKCNNANGEDWYCCPGDPDCSCDTGKFAIKLGGSQPSTVTVIGSTSWPGFTSTSSPFTAQPLNTQGTTTEQSTDQPTASPTKGKPTKSGTSSTSSSTNGTAAAASATASISSGGGGGSSSTLAAGLGAGLGAAAVIIICLGYLAFRRRKGKNSGNPTGGMGSQLPQSVYSEMQGTNASSYETGKNYYNGPGNYHGTQGQHQGYYQSELSAGNDRERSEVDGSGVKANGSRYTERAELGP